MNIPKLKGKIVESEKNVEWLANQMGVNTATLYRKLNSGESITIGDAIKIKDILSLTDEDAYDIFLA